MVDIAHGDVATIAAAITAHSVNLVLSSDRLSVRHKNAAVTVSPRGLPPSATLSSSKILQPLASLDSDSAPTEASIAALQSSTPVLVTTRAGNGVGATHYWQSLMQSAPPASTVLQAPHVVAATGDTSAIVAAPLATKPGFESTSLAQRQHVVGDDGNRPHFNALLGALSSGGGSRTSTASLLSPSHLLK
jgi:hypothetical protein